MPVCTPCVWWIHYWKAAGFFDYRNSVLYFADYYEDALCASGQCYCRGYQYYPLLWTVYRSDSQCVFDFAGEPETVPVFYRSDSVAAAV